MLHKVIQEVTPLNPEISIILFGKMVHALCKFDLHCFQGCTDGFQIKHKGATLYIYYEKN